MQKKRLISRDEYGEILAIMPVVCVDLIVRYKDEFALIKRSHKPAYGKLWLPGGRILKGEKFQQAIRRKLRDEMNITSQYIKAISQLPAGETFFNTSEFGTSTHTINITFLVEVKKKNFSDMGADGKIEWFKKIPPATAPYVKKYLRLVGEK